MAIVALTNIYDGRKSYVVGEIIESLTDKEETRLVKLKYADYVPDIKPLKNQSNKK